MKYKILFTSSIEEFKNLPLFSKLQKAVFFEDLAARDALTHLSMDNVNFGSGFCFRIDAEKMKELDNDKWREMSLCAISMKNYRPIFNKPENCVDLRIGNVEDELVAIDTKDTKKNKSELNKIRPKTLYHVDFVPIRVSIKACHNALECVRDRQLSEFFSNFDHNSVDAIMSDKIGKLKKTLFKDLEWINESIATNMEQQLAIQNIINCTACPFPQIVFGPPG